MTATRRLIAALGLLAILAGPAAAEPISERSGPKLLTPFKPIVAAANAATVRILCDDKDAALGTIVGADGFILTKASELRGAVAVKLGDGSLLDAEIVSVHKPTDLALLKIDMKGLKSVAFADSKKVPIGNWLAAGGLGSTPTAVGIVSVATRNLGRVPDYEMLNQNRGFLGILLSREEEADGGVRIDGFPDSGPSGASKAGLKKDDIIVEMNGTEITNQAALRQLLENYRPGEKVAVKIKRKGEEMKFQVTLTRPAPSRSDIQNNMGGELSGRRTGFPSVLQTDMILDPKNCGGPVVDLDGKVLGISIARAGRVETWILPSETIRPLLADMKAGKYPPLSVKKVLKQSEKNEKK